MLTGIRYEAETFARHSLLVVLAERLGIDLDIAESVISEADDYELSRIGPPDVKVAQDGLRIYQALADRLISAAQLDRSTAAPRIDQDLLVDVLEIVEKVTPSKGITSRKKVQAVLVVYLSSLNTGKVDPEFVKSAIRLACEDGHLGAAGGR